MTIILTISSKEGIVMSADRKISVMENQQIRDVGSRDKIIVFDNYRIAVSYWGLATLQSIQMREHLRNIESQMLENGEPINVDSFASKLKEYLQNYTPRINMGFHVAGYLDDKPKVRHVFHENWHSPNEFTNEESNIESHNETGNRISHTPSEDYIPYLSLFNGDNAVIQSLLLTLPAFRGSNYSLDLLTLNETTELAKLLISTTVNLQHFLRGYRRVGRTCGNGIDIVEITSSTINRVERNLQNVILNVM
jgi:hypothetical protein